MSMLTNVAFNFQRKQAVLDLVQKITQSLVVVYHI